MAIDSSQSEQSEKHTLLIGPLLHRREGLSLAFDLVVQGFVNRGLPFKVIDIGSNNSSRSVGSFNLGRAFDILRALVKYWKCLLFAERIYLLVGLSIVGFFRDCLIIWSAHFLGRRVVLHVHSGGYGKFYKTQSNLIKKLIIKTLINASSIVVLGHLLRKQFDFLSDANDKLYVVPNGLPFELNIDSVPKKNLSSFKTIRLLYLSNLIESKGYLDCIEASRILFKERGISVHIDFCGEFIQHKYGSVWRSKQESIIKFWDLIKTLGLTDVVSYHGVVTGHVKQSFLADAHVLILPTYYEWEGQPICIIEALYFGLPVIATNYRGIPEQVINNYNGFLIEPRNPVKIADCVERMWNEPELYHQMCLNARQHFEENFTQQTHLNRIIPIILGEPIDS